MFFQWILKADKCNAAAMRVDTIFGTGAPSFPTTPTLIFPCMFFNCQTSLTVISTLEPDVVLETLGKTESAFGVDLSHLMHVNSLASILPSRLGSHPLVLKLITLRFLIFLPTAKRPSVF